MGKVYLLEIALTGKPNLDSITKKSPLNSATYVFKVQGENRVVAVFENANRETLMNIDLHSLGGVTSKCTPLILYETFVRSYLGVKDGDFEKKGEPAAIDPKEEVFWIQFDVEYKGQPQGKLNETMRAEALVALGLKYGGQVPLVVYKSVFIRQIHLFIQMEAEAVEGLPFVLPIIKRNGNQVQNIVKVVVPI